MPVELAVLNDCCSIVPSHLLLCFPSPSPFPADPTSNNRLQSVFSIIWVFEMLVEPVEFLFQDRILVLAVDAVMRHLLDHVVFKG